MHALALLITRDRRLSEIAAESSEVESLTIEYVDRLADATERLKLQDAIQALVVDLSQARDIVGAGRAGSFAQKQFRRRRWN